MHQRVEWGTCIVRRDYLTLQLPLGELVYYQLKHVKSLAKKVKESKCGDSYVSCFCSDDDTFVDVLRDLKYKWVKINRISRMCGRIIK